MILNAELRRNSTSLSHAGLELLRGVMATWRAEHDELSTRQSQALDFADQLLALFATQPPADVDKARPHVIWAVWDCSDLAAVFTDHASAEEFRRDRIAETTDAYPPLADLAQQSVTTVAVRLHIER